MTKSDCQQTQSRVGFGALMFGLGSVFGLIVAGACVAVLVVFYALSVSADAPETDLDEKVPDAHVDLILGEDGCHVVRGELEGTTPVRSLTWVITDMDGYNLFERNAEGEYDTKYMRGGQYRVYVSAWHDGRYHQISEEVVVDCPEGP